MWTSTCALWMITWQRKTRDGRRINTPIFHLISAAIGKAFVLRPKMNRFIAYNRVYQRKYISVAFVVKKKFEDKSEEGLAFQYFLTKTPP